MIQHILPESISNNTETFTQILPHNILSDIFEELLPNITTHIFHISCHTIHFQEVFFFFKKKNFMASFCGWGSTASRLEPLQGDNLLFTCKFLVLTLSTSEG